MSKDIENIDTYKTKTKVNTKKWRQIYEVIYEFVFRYFLISIGTASSTLEFYDTVKLSGLKSVLVSSASISSFICFLL